MNQKLTHNTLWAWIAVAVSGPVTIAAGKSNWLWTLGVCLVCGVLCGIILNLSRHQLEYKSWFCVVQYIWAAFFLGQMANIAKLCWPAERGDWAVPLVLLILAVWSAIHGPERASRITGVVFCLLIFLYAVILFSGLKNIKSEWLTPKAGIGSPLLVSVLLLPVVSIFFLKEEGKYGKYLAALSIFALVLSALVSGILSGPLAKEAVNPFYEFSKSLSIRSVAERMESIASVCLTFGYYGLFSLLLSTCGQMVERVNDQYRIIGIIVAFLASAAALFCPIFPDYLLASLSLLVWGIVPVCVLGMGKKKKSEKDENNT